MKVLIIGGSHDGRRLEVPAVHWFNAPVWGRRNKAGEAGGMITSERYMIEPLRFGRMEEFVATPEGQTIEQTGVALIANYYSSAPISEHVMPVPRQIVEAANMIAQWMENHGGGKEWALGPIQSRVGGAR